MKKIMSFLVVLAVLFSIMAPALLLAEETTNNPAVAETTLVGVGNKICLVTGQPVSGVDFIIYKGKRYGACCSMCQAQFDKDPEKYIAKYEASLKAPEKAPASKM